SAHRRGTAAAWRARCFRRSSRHDRMGDQPMTETWTGRKPRELNDETIADVRQRIGIPVRYSPRQHNEVSSTDSFRHFARAYGDGNPLYTDPAYAQASSWGTS